VTNKFKLIRDEIKSRLTLAGFDDFVGTYPDDIVNIGQRMPFALVQVKSANILNSANFIVEADAEVLVYIINRVGVAQAEGIEDLVVTAFNAIYTDDSLGGVSILTTPVDIDFDAQIPLVINTMQDYLTTVALLRFVIKINDVRSM